MEQLETLRAKNPGLPIHSVYDAAFARYGRVIEADMQALCAACQGALTPPESGSDYVLSLPALEEHPDADLVRRTLLGEAPAQFGVCYGHNSQMNALEYHRASEYNIAVTPLLLLLADRRDMRGNDLPAGSVRAFFVPRGAFIEVYATTLHFCPCEAEAQGFICIVILPEGTNAVLSHTRRAASGEDRLLWRRDKWLICHDQNEALIARGAYPGLHGENYTIHY